MLINFWIHILQVHLKIYEAHHSLASTVIQMHWNIWLGGKIETLVVLLRARWTEPHQDLHDGWESSHRREMLGTVSETIRDRDSFPVIPQENVIAWNQWLLFLRAYRCAWSFKSCKIYVPYFSMFHVHTHTHT